MAWLVRLVQISITARNTHVAVHHRAFCPLPEIARPGLAVDNSCGAHGSMYQTVLVMVRVPRQKVAPTVKDKPADLFREHGSKVRAEDGPVADAPVVELVLVERAENGVHVARSESRAGAPDHLDISGRYASDDHGLRGTGHPAPDATLFFLDVFQRID